MKINWVEVRLYIKSWFFNLKWQSVLAGVVAGIIFAKLFL